MTVRRSKVKATISTRGLEALCLDLAEVMFVALDITGHITLINDAGCRILGFSRDELLGADWFTTCIAPQHRREIRDVFNRITSGRAADLKHVRGPVRTRSGEMRMLAWHNIALSDGAGNIIGTLSSGQDITEEHHAQRDRLLQHEMALLAHEAERVEDVFRLAVQRVCDHMDWPLGHAWMADSDADAASFITSGFWSTAARRFRTFVHATRDNRFKPGQGLVGQVAVTRKPRYIPEIADEPQFIRKAAAKSAGLRSVVAFPVLVRGRVAAVLEFFAPQIDQIRPSQLQLMEHIGAQLGRVVERTQAAEELRRSRENLQLAQHIAHIGSYDLHTPTRGDDHWSTEAFRILGRDPAAGPPSFESFLRDVIHPEDRDRAARAFADTLRKGGEFRSDCRILRPDGTIRYIHNVGECFKARRNQPARIVGTLQDITDRWRVEQALRDSEARTRAVLETAVDGIITIDARGYIESVNTAAERTFGYDRAEIIGRNISMLMPQPYRDEHDAYVQRYLDTGKRKIIGIGREVVGQRKDGSVFPMDLAVSEVWQGDRRLFTGIVRDLTERNKMLQQIVHASSEEQQRIGQDLHDGVGQQLTGVAFLSDVLRQNLEAERSPHAAQAREITGIVNESIAHLRALVKGLRPIEFGAEGLSLALKDLAQTTARLFNIHCAAHARETHSPDPATASHLYYIAREAVHNAVRHGHARRVDIHFEADARRILLDITDDGRGLPEGVESTSSGGLRIMAHRARMISGMLQVARARNGGTIVTCRVDVIPRKRTRS